jgi:hypothetical protein
VSLEWTIYAREKPIIENAPSGTSFEVSPYTFIAPTFDEADFDLEFDEADSDLDLDPMASCAWASEMRWKAECVGPRAGLTFSIELARRSQGGIYDHDRRILTWYGWDPATHLARTIELITTDQIGELVSWFGKLGTINSPEPGPLEPLAEYAIAYLDAIPQSTAKNQLLVLLAGREELSTDSRRLLEDAVLAAPPKGKGGKRLRELQTRLRSERDQAWADAQVLPIEPDEVAALWDRARLSQRESYVLGRLFGGDDRALVNEVILAKARAGAPVPEWSFWNIVTGELSEASEYELGHRDRFALCGPLASWLVTRWRNDDAYAAVCEENLDRRRRDGEIYVDLPLDIATLVEQKLHDRAVAEYAKRYELPPERARKVIDAHR